MPASMISGRYEECASCLKLAIITLFIGLTVSARHRMTGHGRAISTCLTRWRNVTLGLPTTFLTVIGIARPLRQRKRVISWQTLLSLLTMIWPDGTTVAGRPSNGTRLPSNWSKHGGVLTCKTIRPRITRSDCRNRPLGARLHGASPSLNQSFRGMAWESCPTL